VHYPRKQTPVRFKRARSDGSLGSLQRLIERIFGLPQDSVRIVFPTGRKMRSDATVGSLRRIWR
jgi:hypothetical protein